MAVQTIELPPDCPECGSRVCLEWGGWTRQPTRAHCGSVHDGRQDCDWDMPLDIDLDADSWDFVTREEL